jgi:hypothetical protein
MRTPRSHTRSSYRKRAGLVLPALIFLTACHGNAYKVATAQNGYDFRKARYDEQCRISSPPAWCAAYYTDLLAAEKHLHEAATALKNGGGMPLQINAIKTDAKGLAR